MIRLAIAAALLAVPAAAQNLPAWVSVSRTPDGLTTVYARTSDLLAGNSTSRAAKVWVKYDESRNPNVRYRQLLALYVVDCVEERFVGVSGTAYFPDGSTRQVPGDRTPSPIVPDSIMDNVSDYLCSDGADTGYKA